jgi:LysR family transcriptional regulator for metE and metH
VERIAPGPRLDIRDLQVVLALASAGSTAGAAARMHLTQSAVSRALCLAEEKLGVRLFERSARGLSPTSSGRALIAGASPLLAQLAELEALARGDEAPVRLRLVCECYTAYRWLPSALANLRRKLPTLEVTLAVEHSGAPVEALRRGDIDVALLTTATVPRGSDVRERPLFTDEVVFLLSSDHPLSRRPHLTAADLCAHPLVTGETPAGEQRWFLRRVFGRRKPKLELVRLPLTEAVVDTVRAGTGIAAMSEWIASGYLGGADLVAKRFASPLHRPWRLACRPSSSELAERLVAALAAAAPRLYASIWSTPRRSASSATALRPTAAR